MQGVVAEPGSGSCSVDAAEGQTLLHWMQRHRRTANNSGGAVGWSSKSSKSGSYVTMRALREGEQQPVADDGSLVPRLSTSVKR
jgi:hypothetical protein